MRNIFLSLLLLLSATVCIADTTPLKVGVILPLSGKGSSVGVSVKNGMLMAYEKLPAATRETLDLQFEDDAAESRQTVSAAQRLMSEGSVDVILTAFSGAGNAVVPLTERANMPLLSLAYDRGISNGKANAFTFWVDVNDMAVAAITEAGRRGYRKVAIVSTLHEGNLAMRETLMRAGSGKIEFPTLEEVQLADTDLNTHVLRVKRGQEVDGIALLMHAAHLGLFVRSLRANGVTLPLFTLGNFEDKGARASAGSDLKGQWYTAAEYSAWFLPAYRQKFPQDSTFGSGFGHDVVLLLAQAGVKGIRRGALSAYLKSGKVTGGAFPEVVADGNNSFRFPVVTKVVGDDGID